MDLSGLQRLQEVDVGRDKAIADLKDITDQIKDPPFIDQLDAEIAAQQDVVRLAEKAVREASAKLQNAERRVKATDESLYSGRITEQRTLQQMQTDLYNQRQQITVMEKDELDLEVAAEDERETLGYLQKLRTDALEHWNAEQRTLETARGESQEAVDEFDRQIEILRERLSPDDLALYDQHRRRNPMVVADVSSGVCDGCRLKVPPVSISRARKGTSAVECPNCGCLMRVI